MDIQRNGNNIHIKADDNDNKINVNRVKGKIEVEIDGEKQVFDGKSKITIDAGGGRDHITVENGSKKSNAIPTINIIGGEGDDDIITTGNVKVFDNEGADIILDTDKKVSIRDSIVGASLNAYTKELNQAMKSEEKPLPIENREKIIEIFKRANDEGLLPELAEKLDNEGKLKPIYRDMGTLMNRGGLGGGLSIILGLVTLPAAGGTFVQEAKLNRTYEMKEIFEQAGVDEKILNKLK